jgi:HTH-type transcriptional regulator/antitoxin HigA
MIRPATHDPLPEEYLQLVQWRPLMRIKDEVDLDNATELMDRLAVLDDPTQGQGEYLDVLTTLVEEYEREHHDIDASGMTPLELLRYLVEQSGMTASALGNLLGQRQLGSAILRGARGMSKAHVVRLADYFKVDARLFLR